jgi:ribosomal protein S3AE
MAQAKRKKRFFDVEIPIINKTTQLQAYELKNLEGKFIRCDLTRSLRGKNLLLQSIVKVGEDKATTIPREIKLMPCFLRRMVRKGTNYVEDSFSTTCKDAKIRIKPFLITRKKVSRAVRNALRKKAREELINYVKDKDSKTLFDEILKNQMQKPLSLKLKKIYPLSLCEIRILKVEKEIEQKKEMKKKTEKKEDIVKKVEEKKEEVKEKKEEK